MVHVGVVAKLRALGVCISRVSHAAGYENNLEMQSQNIINMSNCDVSCCNHGSAHLVLYASYIKCKSLNWPESKAYKEIPRRCTNECQTDRRKVSVVRHLVSQDQVQGTDVAITVKIYSK